ncbi:MAG TPA: hypothetical protein VHD56_09620 [Tepidisphaeraceae bacterium]|nr:hypothetical protein [Tepidisphaeraceae bacterium]
MDGMLEVLRLIFVLDELKGRKKLQKIVHILQSRGFNFPQRFGYLHYGPYSSQLASEIDALVAGNLLKEEKGVGDDYTPYVYELSDEAMKLLKDLNSTGKPPWITLAKNLNEKDPNYLEAMSTILYLKANGFEGNNLRDRFVSLKPHLKAKFDKALAHAASLPKA